MPIRAGARLQPHEAAAQLQEEEGGDEEEVVQAGEAPQDPPRAGRGGGLSTCEGNLKHLKINLTIN